MKTKIIVKTLIGIIVIGGGISYFTYQAMQSSWAYYYSVDDFAANKAAVKNSTFRIAGTVKPGSVIRNMEEMNLKFTLAGTGNELSVNYKGTIPDNFIEDGEVVVEGMLDTSGTFQANTLMTKCESKYKAKVK